MSDTFKFTFNSDQDENVVISIPHANSTTSAEDVKLAMEAIITTGVVPTTGSLTEIVKAELVEVLVQDLAIN